MSCIMTNDDFAEFVLRHWPTKSSGRPNVSAAARALDLDRETVKALCDGVTRKGMMAPVPRYVELAAKAIDAGLDRD